MSKTVALLSGKGGSGKTTLALSIATMLADCGVKVLLVDCDLSTNGATYFYEAKLPDVSSKVTSFYDILFNTSMGDYQYIKISPNFDFMPSISQITKESTATYSYQSEGCLGWKKFYDQVCKEYSVVLFDCQAGYADILKTILPMIDIDLFVMEADAISSAAIRSLYLKIGNIIKEKKVYQLFNKVTAEEHKIYSQLSGGTVFTNIEAIIFDWKIRKAFSVAQVPDMRNSSAYYGKQIYDVCNILFVDKSVQTHLEQFELVIEMHENAEEGQRIQSKIDALKEQAEIMSHSRTKSISLIFLFTTVLLTILAFFLFVNSEFLKGLISGSEIEFIVPIAVSLVTVCSMTLSYINVIDITKDRRNHYKELDTYQKMLNEIIDKEEKIQAQLKNYKMHIGGTEGSTVEQ